MSNCDTIMMKRTGDSRRGTGRSKNEEESVAEIDRKAT